MEVKAQIGPVMPSPPMQRVHKRHTPLTAAELSEARTGEQARLAYDPMYITAEQARSIPQAALTPEILQRIQYSQRDWPENLMSMNAALGPLSPGTGEVYIGERTMNAGDVFWKPGVIEPM